ncbi:methylated-DNA--[protein]-cysteine S-methyltransferase [Pseudomonas nicosulfuronedens]|uniref:Methylated-DNA--protein-cysteine methyltransferase n=1 Tax=Pseudomonas nicosulfuronedens TaxID=2571105 RepID=A0A5R9QV99_9PSED|nr:methylated-DNA--[protein]-cysteine S-methyltransferase [Pseudomonas nicosulfuronedens]MDH1011209.1 methylated-DNA--[protein]-cysteine S-methyltransferase [Pseudomonas nicosulfuronedens]MDH1981312.1 methylated-DNA--[protein]-cysteine S-methyltransferase [Pseudomonas nicosulfuronedens]MDH2029222.1 methylated-DNA--[protein]-cysteine S-methyltransferase [Pseudomonas nicosulfuronedens]TLX73786.1 methylated-DNA--[protein]-cysteine S-methyltransferase [Pseudomonas nicosulfuronedens]
MHYRYHDSPTGRLLLAGDEGGLRMLYMDLEVRHYPQPDWQEGSPLLDDVARQLDEYFAGKRQRFDVKLNTGGTEFQRQVWQALLEIPYGYTTVYAELARRIGRPKAIRAVGAANGANPISIIVPCHRVIGSNGSLTGYAGGLPRKELLLRLEGALESA